VNESTVLDADEAFFAALLAADPKALDGVLAEGFALVDVFAGQVIPRDVLLGLVSEARLEFLEIARDPADVSVRQRAGLGVVVGRTRMTIRAEGVQVTANSRYTHVFVADDGGWRLLSAQGTPVTGAGPRTDLPITGTRTGGAGRGGASRST
jgi:Domain of unknown function (DUF4440)